MSSLNYHVHYGFGQHIKLKPKLINSRVEVPAAIPEEALDADMSEVPATTSEGMQVDTFGDSKDSIVHITDHWNYHHPNLLYPAQTVIYLVLLTLRSLIW